MLSILWALASPIFSVPDENAHAAKAIAQVRGEAIGHREPGVRHLVVDVPPEFSFSPQIQCFVYHPETPATCGVELGDPGGTDWAATWVSTYNPIYYYVVGWPTFFWGGSVGIYAMRIVSGLVGAAFLAWGFQAAMASARARWMPVGIAFAATPMVLYLNGAINPNGIEIAAAIALWAALLRLLERFTGPDETNLRALPVWHLWAIVTLSSVALANARALGPLWLVVIVGVCFSAVGLRAVRRLFAKPSSYWFLSVIAMGGLFSLVWTLSGGSLSGQAEKSDAPLVGASFLTGFSYMIRTIPAFLKQSFGYFGWFDAPLPEYVDWIVIAAFAALVVLAFSAVRRRGVMSLGVVALASTLVPALVQGYSVHQTGIIWQGRYGLFLYLGIPIIAGWVLSSREGERVAYLSARYTWVVAAMLWLFGCLAFVFVLRRYVVGNAEPITAMLKDPQWQPPLGWILLAVSYTVVSAVFFLWVGRRGVEAVRG
jgi:hypothetical protein